MFKDKNENYRLKIAFDFDDTLTENLFFALAKHLILKGHDVWIMTARESKNRNIYAGMEDEEDYLWNNDLYRKAAELGLKNKIIFTNLADKSAAFKDNGFDLLFDDDAEWHCNPICEAGGVAVNV
jgi:hypothetical protein